jgi:transposase-like protein
MGQKSGSVKEPAEQLVKEIRRATRRQFSAEEKIRIVLTGLRGEDSIAELCRREGIVQNLYYRWSKEFLKPARSAWPGTPRGRRPRTRSRICAARPAR